MSLLKNIPECDIFYPSLEEFKDFQTYMSKCEKESNSGIIKIIPPKGYKARKEGYKSLDFSIPNPIEQIVNGQNGIYDVILLQTEPKTLLKYQKIVEGNEKIIENKKQLEIEDIFWNSLKYKAPLYGADTPGSIFDENALWNLSKIDTLLKKGLNNDIIGVTTPYLYVGAWKTLFAWHKEDMDLNSINYLHFGKNKIWYGIHPQDAEKFEALAKKFFPDESRKCPEFLRHKTYLINPSILVENGLRIHKYLTSLYRCIQRPGDFVVTFPAAYHCGFNTGFNCAEAVNFALESWVKNNFLSKAKACSCRPDSVKIDKELFANNLNNKLLRSPQKSISVDKENHHSPSKKSKSSDSPKLKSSIKINKFEKKDRKSPKKKKTNRASNSRSMKGSLKPIK